LQRNHASRQRRRRAVYSWRRREGKDPWTPSRVFNRDRLQWKHISFEDRRLSIRRSKTPAGWRDPSLNDTCLEALRELHRHAAELRFADPEHFLFLWHGRDKKLDPTRPMTSWRSAWRSLRQAAGLSHVRFHDGRHTALTGLAEKGVPDWVIRAQFGHVSPAMMAVYSHVRRKALNEAAKALEPDAAPTTRPTPEPADAERPLATKYRRGDSGVMSHVTSQHVPSRHKVIEFPKKSGSSGWTRTSNPPVNSGCGFGPSLNTGNLVIARR